MKKEWLPNAVTLSRGVMTLLIVGLFYTDISFRYYLIFGLFVLAMASDFVDGLMARRWQCISKFGTVADSMLDKVLVLTVMMMLIPYQLLPTVVYVLFFVREMVVDSIKNMYAGEGKPKKAFQSGRYKMAVETMLILVLIIRLAGDNYWWQRLSIILAIAGLVLAYYSAALYINQWRKSLVKAV